MRCATDAGAPREELADLEELATFASQRATQYLACCEHQVAPKTLSTRCCRRGDGVGDSRDEPMPTSTDDDSADALAQLEVAINCSASGVGSASIREEHAVDLHAYPVATMAPTAMEFPVATDEYVRSNEETKMKIRTDAYVKSVSEDIKMALIHQSQYYEAKGGGRS